MFDATDRIIAYYLDYKMIIIDVVLQWKRAREQSDASDSVIVLSIAEMVSY